MNAVLFKTRSWGLWEVALITALALGFRLLHLEEQRHSDSYLHIMAAASLLTDGTLSLGGEVQYDRAYLFTYLVAAFQSVFGGTTFVAGVPALLAGVAWVAVLFVWVRSTAGRTAAWVAGLLFAFDVWSLALAHMVRFYTLHGLAFFLGAIGLYYIVTRRPPWGTMAVTAAAVIGAFWFAYHLQYTTVVGGIALAVWLVVEMSPRVFLYFRDHRSRAIALAIPIVVGGSVAGFLFVQSEAAARYWGMFSTAAPWAEPRVDDLTYYIRRLERTYGFLWALFPVAAIVAIARYGRPAVFSLLLFVVPLVVHSLAAFKAPRFLGYAIPFFFVIWGLAIAAALPYLKVVARRAVSKVGRSCIRGQVFSFLSHSLLFAVLVGVALTGRSVWWEAYKFVAENERPSGMTPHRWDKAAARLRPVVESVDVVVISGVASSDYYVDYVHVKIHTSNFSGDPEFSKREPAGVPGISAPQSLETLTRCYSSGLVAVDNTRWGRLSHEMIETLQANAQPFPLPEEWGVRAYTWSHDVDVGEEVDCPVLEAHRAPRL